jgi:23S rRNA pseudouridine2605 synthase
MPLERLQKIISTAGIASRRKAEELITAGLVTVNGAVVTELGSKADLETDHIKVSGKLLRPPRTKLYIALHKPINVMTTVNDPEGRDTVMGLLRGVKERVYPVGRLDYHSEGLLLMTNDGDFANKLTAKESHVPKTYLVKVTGTLTHDQEEAFRRGLPIEGRRTAPAGLKLVRSADNPWYEVRLFEGRKNQIRMMFKHSGLLVEKLKRVRIGSLTLGSLKPGEFRYLTPDEVHRLLKVEKPPKGHAAHADHAETGGT